MMLTVAICDDNQAICHQLERMIEVIQPKINDTVDIDVYGSAEALWSILADQQQIYDLIFLDIELPGSTGIELAHKIRFEHNDQMVQIAFISAKTQYALELFSVGPVDFLIKPIQRAQVQQVLIRTINLKQDNAVYFQYTDERMFKRVPHKMIESVSVMGKLVSLLINNGQILTYRGTFSEAMTQLEPYGFIQINKSEAINCRYIHGLNREQIQTTSGANHKISRRYQKAVAAKLMFQKGEG